MNDYEYEYQWNKIIIEEIIPVKGKVNLPIQSNMNTKHLNKDED